MKKAYLIYLTIIVVTLSSFVFLLPEESNNDHEQKTEELYYKLKLGWFTLGSGRVKIEYNSMNISGSNYHRVFAHASTLGLGNWLSNLDDNYSALIHHETAKSFNSYKNVTAGDSRWEQWNNFDYDSMKVNVKIKDFRKEDPEMNWSVDMNPKTYDILGTFLFFKNHNWDAMNTGDSIMIYTLYERKLYRVGMHYKGIEKLNVSGNKVDAHKMHLLIPDQKKLKKDRPVVIWISTDENHYPLKIFSKLFIGSARCELHTVNAKEPMFTNQAQD